MNLIDIVNNSKTDKNTGHSYLELYHNLLKNKRESAKNVLEVGIGDFGEKNGGSIKMWRDYFTKAIIYGLDILPISRVMDEIINDDRIILYTEKDAYNEDLFKNEFLNKNIKFDFMLDDGPHTLESMIKFIKLYSQIMEDDGILIIEDVQSISWIDILKNEVPDNLKKFIKVYDLRYIKNRYDDIVFTIDKSNNFIDDESKEEWIFYEELDSLNHDIRHIPNLSVDSMKMDGQYMNNCVAFNTFGFFKSKIEFPLVRSNYYGYGKKEGIYIKKSYLETNNLQIE